MYRPATCTQVPVGHLGNELPDNGSPVYVCVVADSMVQVVQV